MKHGSYTEQEGQITAHFSEGTEVMHAELEGILKQYVPHNDAEGHHRLERALTVLEKLMTCAANDAKNMVHQARQQIAPT